MKKQTLKAYSASALAFLGVESIHAQIIYTDVEPDVVLMDTLLDGLTVEYQLDFDDDGSADFRIFHAIDFSLYMYNSDGGIYMEENNYALAQMPASVSQYMPVVVNAGDPVDSDGIWIHSQTIGGSSFSANIMLMGIRFFVPDSSFELSLGPWAGGQTDKYIGLKKMELDGMHYGWVRLDIPEGFGYVKIKGYAFNKTPDEPVLAGETGPTDIPAIYPDAPAIYFDGKTLNIGVKENVTNAIFGLTDMQGRKILQSELRNAQNEFLLSDLPAGIYIVQVQYDYYSWQRKISVH